MADLDIPQAAVRELADLVETASGGEIAFADTQDVRRIAAPVVAAELRRIAAELVETFSPDTPQIHSAMATVRARADELDGGGAR